MSKKKVCCSFDYDNDRKYYNLLETWNKNDNIDFYIDDCTPREIQSESITTIKQVLSTKIGQADYMIGIIGKYSDSEHPDSKDIGYKNWQAYEIDKNHEKGNGLVVVKLDSLYYPPNEAYGQGAKWVNSFNLEEILTALNELVK